MASAPLPSSPAGRDGRPLYNEVGALLGHHMCDGEAGTMRGERYITEVRYSADPCNLFRIVHKRCWARRYRHPHGFPTSRIPGLFSLLLSVVLDKLEGAQWWTTLTSRPSVLAFGGEYFGDA